jgi:acyl-CoA reductase-like NAD-dependent aldehyde dehydrogenase
MATTADTLTRDKLFIDGGWVEPAGSGTIDVVNPATEEVIGSIPEGTSEDADRAVRAATAAFASWSVVDAHERAGLCAAIGAKLTERADELAVLITSELGMPLEQARAIQAGLPALNFASMTDIVGRSPGRRRSATRSSSASPSAWWRRSPPGIIRSTRSPSRSPRR